MQITLRFVVPLALAGFCHAQGLGVNKSMQGTQAGKIQYALVLSPVKGVALNEPSAGDLVKKGVLDAASRDAVAPVLPYSVVLQNTGTRSAVGYAVRFDVFNSFAKQDGGLIFSNIKDVDHMPDKRGTWVQLRDFRTAEPKLKPGGMQLVAFDPLFTDAIAAGTAAALPRDPAYASHVDSLKPLAGASIIVASLDSVLFDDGEFAGPDAAGSFNALNQRVAHDVAMAKQLHTLDGQPDASVLTMLAKYAREANKAAEPALGGVRVSSQPSFAMVLGLMLESDGRAKYEAALNALPQQLSVAVWRGKKK